MTDYHDILDGYEAWTRDQEERARRATTDSHLLSDPDTVLHDLAVACASILDLPLPIPEHYPTIIAYYLGVQKLSRDLNACLTLLLST